MSQLQGLIFADNTFWSSGFQKSFWLCPLPFSGILQIHTEDVINIIRYGEERRKNMQKIGKAADFTKKCYPQKMDGKF